MAKEVTSLDIKRIWVDLENKMNILRKKMDRRYNEFLDKKFHQKSLDDYKK